MEAWKGNWGFIVDGYYTSLGSIANTQLRIASRSNALDYLLSRGINTNLGEFVDQLDRQIQGFREVKEAKTVEIAAQLEALTQKVQTLKEILGQDLESLQAVAENIDSLREEWAQKEQRLETLAANIEYLGPLRESGFGLEPDQKIKAAIALNSAAVKNRDQLQDLQAELENLRNPSNLDPIRQNLRQIQETLQATRQKVAELRRIEESEPLRQLETALEDKEAQVAQTLAKVDSIQNLIDNRGPQEVNNDVTSSLDFNQGIYDFAVTYNLGDTPQTGLPKEPSGLSFPRLWFQPIVGARLNSLNLKLEDTINYQISSALVNIEGAVRNTYQAGKVWFEPLLGAKVSLQLSDPLALWLRGDYSGFGMAGETNYSWNLIFGMDYWARENMSLQLGYRFYEINYQNGSGSDAFGFSENFNGPFLSASFYF
ncbi:MAG: hypothetical protein GC158_09270 [Cyanobacteria bacterium RI_101]|nr:hypothetical protein [Cyanobacteria bacterium RI_101]